MLQTKKETVSSEEGLKWTKEGDRPSCRQCLFNYSHCKRGQTKNPHYSFKGKLPNLGQPFWRRIRGRTRIQKSRFWGIDAEKTPWLPVSLVAFSKDASESIKALILEKRDATRGRWSGWIVNTQDAWRPRCRYLRGWVHLRQVMEGLERQRTVKHVCQAKKHGCQQHILYRDVLSSRVHWRGRS